MTEVEWDEGHDPTEMLEALRDCSSGNQFVRYAILCLRYIGAESTADILHRRLTGERVENTWLAARIQLEIQARRHSGGGYSQGRKPVRIPLATQRARAGLAALHSSPWEAAVQVTQETRHQLQRSQSAWLKCLFSNPFRPISIDPAWLTDTVTNLATVAYEERNLPSGELDPVRLAVLSDALEESGCNNADMLRHLRGPGPHVRGCWVVDLLLGKS